MANTNTSWVKYAPWIQYTLCAHRFGLTAKAILMDLRNYHNEKVTIEDIKEILFNNNQLPRETYLWYSWEYRSSHRTHSEISYPWNAWTARYAYRCKSKKMSNMTIWEHMHFRGYELPIDTPIIHILDAREFIENHLLAVCQNPIALADVYIPTVLRAHSWGYTLSEILLGIFAENVDEDDMRHLRTTLDNHGVGWKMQHKGRSFTEGEGEGGDGGSSIIEEFAESACLIGMRVDEIWDLCYAHGFDLVDGRPLKDIFVRLGVVAGDEG